ncbi:hypothetical protein GGR51DRAFT_228420 [Nemania sp. FL0031]|nr:hypothetical protein GGR51DRAFT_228420 [Nemania sp. FL0031]
MGDVGRTPEPSTEDDSLVFYNPRSFSDVLASPDADIEMTDTVVEKPPYWLTDANHRMREAYYLVQTLAKGVKDLRADQKEELEKLYRGMTRAYNTLEGLCAQHLEFTDTQVAHFQKYILEASLEFSQNVWGTVARLTNDA